jgi:hypothetical protein
MLSLATDTPQTMTFNVFSAGYTLPIGWRGASVTRWWGFDSVAYAIERENAT